MLKYPRLRRHIVGTNFPTTLTMGNIYQTYYFTPKNEAGIAKRDPLSVIFFTARWPLRKDEKGEFVRKCGGNRWLEKYAHLSDFHREKPPCQSRSPNLLRKWNRKIGDDWWLWNLTLGLALVFNSSLNLNKSFQYRWKKNYQNKEKLWGFDTVHERFDRCPYLRNISLQVRVRRITRSPMSVSINFGPVIIIFC